MGFLFPLRDVKEEYAEKFFFLVACRCENEIKFTLYMVEHLLKGRDCFLG